MKMEMLCVLCFVFSAGIFHMIGAQSSDQGCEPSIQVPMFSNKTFSVEENTNLTVPFTVHCVKSPNTSVAVVHGTTQHDTSTLCDYLNPKSAEKNCQCINVASNNGYNCSFTDIISRVKTNWRIQFYSPGSISSELKTFNINVTYPTKVKILTINGTKNSGYVDENTNPHVRCYWEPGNPPRRIIIGKDGERTPLGTSELQKQYPEYDGNPYMTVLLNRTTCSDYGTFYCQVEGEPRTRKTINLSIKCPPTFPDKDRQPNISIPLNSKFKRNFSLISYKKQNTCWLRKPRGTTDNCFGTKSLVTISGKPPNLTLSLTLKKVTKGDSGKWRIFIENGIGKTSSLPKTAEMTFNLQVTETTTTTTTTTTTPSTTSTSSTSSAVFPAFESTSNTSQGEKLEEGKKPADTVPGWMMAAIGVPAVLVVAAIGAIVLVCHRRDKHGPGFSSQDTAITNASRRESRQQDCDMIVNEIYGLPEGVSNPAQCGDTYVGMDQVKKTKAEQKAKKNEQNASAAVEGATYVNSEEVQKNKEKQGKSKEASKANNHEEEAVYTGAEEVRTNKEKQRKNKQKNTPTNKGSLGPDTNVYFNTGDVTAQCVSGGAAVDESTGNSATPGTATTNKDGLTYGDLDFTNVTPRRTLTIKDTHDTNYAEIKFQATPPGAPAKK